MPNNIQEKNCHLAHRQILFLTENDHVARTLEMMKQPECRSGLRPEFAF